MRQPVRMTPVEPVIVLTGKNEKLHQHAVTIAASAGFSMSALAATPAEAWPFVQKDDDHHRATVEAAP